jgi:hypothetical protein
VDAKATASNMTGSVKYDYSFMPMQEGSYQIPRVELVYFNPDTKQYETAYAQGYTINVAKGKDSSKSQTREKAVFNPDLMEVGNLSHTHNLFVGTLGYWLAYIIPFLALVIVAFWRRAYIKANADIIAVRSRKAGRVATKRLKKAAACMKRGDVEAFYDEILSSLWGFAADKLKMPGSELNRDNIRENLTSRGVENDVIDDFIHIIDESEFAKYAPGSAAAQMNDTYSKASDIINAINKSIK